jgi:hypothetical protein
MIGKLMETPNKAAIRMSHSDLAPINRIVWV